VRETPVLERLCKTSSKTDKDRSELKVTIAMKNMHFHPFSFRLLPAPKVLEKIWSLVGNPNVGPFWQVGILEREKNTCANAARDP
jgi:hypothetical protein